MKKLMIAAAAMVLALGAQASSAAWSISYWGEDYTGTGANALLFDSGSKTAVLAIFNDFGAEGKTLSDLQALAINSAPDTPGVATPSSYARNATNFSEVPAIDVSSAQSVFAVLFEGSIAVGTKYQMADAKPLDGYTVEPPTPTSKTLLFVETDFTTAGTITGGAPVPEPTSGLLLLLGVAGMALRRKRA